MLCSWSGCYRAIGLGQGKEARVGGHQLGASSYTNQGRGLPLQLQTTSQVSVLGLGSLLFCVHLSLYAGKMMIYFEFILFVLLFNWTSRGCSKSVCVCELCACVSCVRVCVRMYVCVCL